MWYTFYGGDMMFENLDKSTLFLNFSKEEINDVLKNIGYYTKSFIKEEFIAFRGDSINCFMILLEGELIAEMQKLNGKVIKIENLLPFSDIAPAFVFGKDNTFPVDLYAIKNSKILENLIYVEEELKTIKRFNREIGRIVYCRWTSSYGKFGTIHKICGRKFER